MSTVICPHCGFNNFSISAYCAKCERPLQSDVKSAPHPAARAAPRPPPMQTQSGTSSLPPASQVAQQILQRRPPVPTPPASAPLPPAQQVAQQILQKRASSDDASAEPTRIARVPVEMQRALVGERSQAGQQQIVVQNRPPLQPMPRSIHTDPTRAGGDLDRTVPDAAEEATAVFTAPTLLDKPATAKPQEARSAPAPQPRPAAAPSLPPPTQARDVLPTAREPAAKPAAPQRSAPPAQRKPSPNDQMVFPRTEPGIDAAVLRAAVPAARPESPFPKTESGVAGSVVRPGAAPPQRTAPRPPVAPAGAFESAAGWRILLGYAVDIALLVGFFALLVNIDAALTGPKGLDAHGKAFEFLANHPGSTLRAAIMTMLAATAYHAILNQMNGRTLGRMVAGTSLARRSGLPMSWFIVAVRTVASFISLFAFGAGFFWAIVDNRGRAFHDLVSGTMVVRHRRA